MDALSAILKASKLEAIVCSQSQLSGDWGLDVEPAGNAYFWRVSRGSCMIGLHGGPAVTMQTGDIVVIPHGARHWIARTTTSPRITIAEYVQAPERFTSQEPAETIVAAGHFTFDEEQQHPFIKDLPHLLHITSFGIKNQEFLSHMGFLLNTELNVNKPGTQMMLKGLAEMLFISVIRAYLEQHETEKGFLSALADPQISQALELMHAAPSQDWTAAALGKQVGMSRTLFFNRFKALVGETPLTYLTNWRINRAKEMLAAGMDRVDVAERIGYQSEAAFNKIFKTKTGSTPAKYKATKLN